MANWYAIIDNKSEVDASGRITVHYTVYLDDEEKYGYETSCFPTEVDANIQATLVDIKAKNVESKEVQIGDVILIEGDPESKGPEEK